MEELAGSALTLYTIGQLGHGLLVHIFSDLDYCSLFVDGLPYSFCIMKSDFVLNAMSGKSTWRRFA